MKLIIGLGNPGNEYKNTRHNTGSMAVEWLATKHRAKWQAKPKLHVEQTQIEINGIQILLIKPAVNYNHSGMSVRHVKDFYNIENEDILVIHDELALPFGTVRVRPKGSDAGNNGIKNVNAHIGEDYPRIRVGISNVTRQQNDIDFVLSRFSRKEEAKLSDIFEIIENIIHEFAADSLEPISHSL